MRFRTGGEEGEFVSY